MKLGRGGRGFGERVRGGRNDEFCFVYVVVGVF